MPGFRTVDHQIPCQHIREYPRALAHEQEDVLHLAVKQYIPLNNPNPQRGDVTIIAAHANAFPKELYEPVWDELLKHAEINNWKIRSIWMADVAHQGESAVTNEDLLGNDPSWLDHSRDLLHMINVKRDEMPRPIVGIGHSMGGAQLVHLAYIHPRLLTTLVLLDPVIQETPAAPDEKTASPSIAQLSTWRRDVWPSRPDAENAFANSPFYKSWDPRVFQKWIEHGLREMPTILHPETTDPPQVTLTTPVPQELFQFIRPNYDGHGVNGKTMNRATHPDIDQTLLSLAPFYRPEPPAIFKRLGELRPSALYIFGGTSDVSTPEHNALKISRTGTGPGGSGGAREGRVKALVFEGVGHLVAMEAVDKTATEIGQWIGSEMHLYRAEQKRWETEWKSKTLRDKQSIDDQWRRAIGKPSPRIKKNSKI